MRSIYIRSHYKVSKHFSGIFARSALLLFDMANIETSVGKEALSYCTKCRMDLAHTIVAMKGDQIAKVECKTCHTIHQFRAPKGITEPAPKAKRKAKGAEGGSSKATVEDTWNQLMSDHKAKPEKGYNVKSTFLVGDKIAHKTFGQGFVSRVIYPNKIEVIFRNDVRVLIHHGQHTV